jgi:uncharacterized protein DUF1353
VKVGFLTRVTLDPVGFDRWLNDKDVQLYSEKLKQAKVEIAPEGILTIKAGFICDLDSIPRWVPILYALLKGRAVKESLPHDLLYRTGEVPRPLADAVMLEMMIAEGQEAWVRNAIYSGVRTFGGFSYKRKNPGEPQLAEPDEEQPIDQSPGA